jgi:diguanylate cyclase
VGDHVLRLVSVAISQAVHGGDFVARYGGEEFVVVLPQTGLDGALAVAENIRQAIASKRLTRKSTGEALGMITLSLGAAQYRLDETAGRVIQRADEALYRAKREGRNRVDSEECMGDFRCLTSAAQ